MKTWFEKYWYLLLLATGNVCTCMAKNYIILTHTVSSKAQLQPCQQETAVTSTRNLSQSKVQIMEALNDTKVDRNFPWPAIQAN